MTIYKKLGGVSYLLPFSDYTLQFHVTTVTKNNHTLSKDFLFAYIVARPEQQTNAELLDKPAL